jgi:hypothetical protein
MHCSVIPYKSALFGFPERHMNVLRGSDIMLCGTDILKYIQWNLIIMST